MILLGYPKTISSHKSIMSDFLLMIIMYQVLAAWIRAVLERYWRLEAVPTRFRVVPVWVRPWFLGFFFCIVNLHINIATHPVKHIYIRFRSFIAQKASS